MMGLVFVITRFVGLVKDEKTVQLIFSFLNIGLSSHSRFHFFNDHRYFIIF